MNNLLEVRGLCKRYGDFALQEVSFALPPGYVMGLVGANGAGKTTVIKAILSLIRRDAGEIRLFGLENTRNTETVHQQVGAVLDFNYFLSSWRMADVEKAAAPFYKSWDSAQFHALLQRFDIDPKKRVKELSHGMKMKLSLAVALSHDARLLILDEPTGGLDSASRQEVCEILREFALDERRSVLFSTHIVTDLEKVADYITFLRDGKILFTETKEALLERYVRVKGADALDAAQRELLFGLHESAAGYTGLAQAAALPRLPADVLTEPATLEEIVICLERGGEPDA